MTEIEILKRKLDQTLSEKSKPVQEAIAQIEKTGSLLDDYVAPTSQLGFENGAGGVRLILPETGKFSLHNHAVNQIGEKLSVPPVWLRGLVGGESWQRDMAVEVLSRSSLNGPRDRVLLRTVEGQVRGFLSDKYKRLNSMEIFLAFLTAANEMGHVLVDAHSGETKGYLEVINREIMEFDTPQNGRNYAVFGARLANSDFGDGTLSVRIFMLMVKCWNGMVGESMLREVHLGKRIPENIQISEDTYRKETTAKAALVRDIMGQVFLPENTGRIIQKIEGASSKTIDVKKEIELLPKLGFTVAEKDAVEKVMIENDPANGLQGAPTLWKLINGMTAVARDAQPERRRDLEIIAGQMLR